MGSISFRVLPVVAMLLIGNQGYSQYSITPAKLPASFHAPVTVSDYDQLKPQGSYAIPWVYVHEADILWKKRVWREIDVKDKGNKGFGGDEATINSSLFSIMVEGFNSGAYKAYDAADDRFTKQLTKEEFARLTSPGSQMPVPGFNAAMVTKFKIKEDWLFQRNENKLEVRIVGIAPVMEMKNQDGTVSEQPLFWLYYPEIRTWLAAHKVQGNKADEYMDWDHLFELRKFVCTLEKVSGYPEPHMPPTK